MPNADLSYIEDGHSFIEHGLFCSHQEIFMAAHGE